MHRDVIVFCLQQDGVGTLCFALVHGYFLSLIAHSFDGY